MQEEDQEAADAHHVFEVVIRLLLSHGTDDLSGQGQTVPETIFVSILQTFEKELYCGLVEGETRELMSKCFSLGHDLNSSFLELFVFCLAFALDL